MQNWVDIILNRKNKNGVHAKCKGRLAKVEPTIVIDNGLTSDIDLHEFMEFSWEEIKNITNSTNPEYNVSEL